MHPAYTYRGEPQKLVLLACTMFTDDDKHTSYKNSTMEIGSRQVGVPYGKIKGTWSTRSKARPGLRTGKWTIEEEQYAVRLAHYFKIGLLNVAPGTMLRLFLAEKLNCEPMRITKKFTGDECIGKQVFRPGRKTPLTANQLRHAESELTELEKRYMRRTYAIGGRKRRRRARALLEKIEGDVEKSDYLEASYCADDKYFIAKQITGHGTGGERPCKTTSCELAGSVSVPLREQNELRGRVSEYGQTPLLPPLHMILDQSRQNSLHLGATRHQFGAFPGALGITTYEKAKRDPDEGKRGLKLSQKGCVQTCVRKSHGGSKQCPSLSPVEGPRREYGGPNITTLGRSVHFQDHSHPSSTAFAASIISQVRRKGDCELPAINDLRAVESTAISYRRGQYDVDVKGSGMLSLGFLCPSVGTSSIPSADYSESDAPVPRAICT